MAAYDYLWDDVSGKKAWFFTPEAMYCLGAGISASKANPVITTLNQCFSSGPVTIKNNNKVLTMEGTTLSSGTIKWIHHDRVGYLLPSGGNISVKNADQTGSWYDINLSMQKNPVTSKVFSAWLNHGNDPSGAVYEYIVVPSKSLTEFIKWENKNPFRLIINTPEVQALFDKNENVYGIAFYRAGSVSLKEGLKVESDMPCLLLVRKESGNSYKISVSDPTASLAEVTIKISGELTGPGSTINMGRTTSINFIFPSGDDAGRSLSGRYVIK
jgi:hypothetical protein